ncbi:MULTISPECIES: hypothetical protein [Olivibacter]|jgi:hypothetical protein|uniref:Uncharacterized protein n=2 Tax=Olivibacter TaxID=376469 RepID=A0ABV6HNS4_9SPHI|nr:MULTISPECIES: hypothetical protein [Olivibacter]MCL4640784.1 hypothetical protein [Olivibacter sp. UJ_SKK_5.1]MDM8175778.1 hypothetical protein [Olivibacter sp. 47]MDX3914386.1 hypothetical protein [Pseudosphingobacterium sp.]QEL02509.1 hypothetical protein FKG96_17380 [Olivibacter sp. LS-1]
MKLIINCLIALALCSCSKDNFEIETETDIYTWNRELYRITPSYKYINNVRISDEPKEEFVSYDVIKLSSQQAQQQQDSLFQASNGKYLYRFKKVSTHK